MNSANAATWQNTPKNYVTWRQNLSLGKKLLFCLLLAALTGVGAQIKFYLPFSPVPITLQTFFVLLSGAMLGKNWAGVSQILYVLIGAAGVPWFANGAGGLSYLTGATAGYLLGFVVAAFVVGWLYDKWRVARQWLPLIGIMIVCHLVFVYGFGLAYLAIWANAIQGTHKSFNQILWMGCLPFLMGDILKILAASFLSSLLNPKKS